MQLGLCANKALAKIYGFLLVVVAEHVVIFGSYLLFPKLINMKIFMQYLAVSSNVELRK